MFKRLLLTFFLFAFSLLYVAGQNATIKGKVTSMGEPLANAAVVIIGTSTGTYTNEKGFFNLNVQAEKTITITITHLGNLPKTYQLNLKNGEVVELNPDLQVNENAISTVQVEDNGTRQTTMQRLDPKLINVIPNTTQGIEALIKTLPGVVSNNDLSSQYSVRGGNYDENLVYVNDIEIFRPFLVRSGQQEGLSFVNPDMVSSILFSAGGFESRYGDKMSSVLDIKYKKKPARFGGSGSLGTLGGSINLEGTSKNEKFTYLLGFRQKQNSYLLKTLDVKGSYKPSFSDFQSFLTYTRNEKWEFNFLGNFARNRYLIVPESQYTKVGTVNQALGFYVQYAGKENDIFQNGMGAFSAIYTPKDSLTLKFITSAFRSLESENYDIEGAYRLDQLENDFGKDDFGKAKFNLGTGYFLNHARNKLNATIYNTEHRGTYLLKNHRVEWGIKIQNEQITDKLSEWRYIDSAGYSLPQYPATTVNIYESYKATNSINTIRYTGFVQNNFYFNDTSIFHLNLGVRFQYWDMNKQFLTSPRGTFTIKPKWKTDIVFRFSSGIYYQSPFYRELRNLNGNLNYNIKAQQSIHFVAALDYNLKIWSRPFKLVAESYYKLLDNLIPYQIDNVRIRYFATNNAKGYARGIDLKLNGEFVKGIESWASFSYMQTFEDLKDDYYYKLYNKAGEQIFKGITFDQTPTDTIKIEPGYIPRPMDQRYSFALFFQDYIPRFPSYKMSLNLIFGSGLPFGPPDYNRYKQTLRYPFYRRVDLGLSKQLITEASELGPKNPLRHLKSMWIGLDVFNLLGISNVVSYNWVKDVNGQLYGIPNYLSARLINLRLQITF